MENDLHFNTLNLSNNPDAMRAGDKNGCQGAEHVMLAGAYPPTVQTCVLTNLQENTDLGMVSILILFMKMGLLSADIYRVCPCIDTRKTANRKAESERRVVKIEMGRVGLGTT